VGFEHYPPVDELARRRVRDAMVAWAPLLGELMAVGLRPYLELESGDHEDPLRLYCELENGLLLDISRADEGLPDTPSEPDERYWAAFVQAEGGYLAEVTIDETVTFSELAGKLIDLVQAVAAGERPLLDDW
jgi:hypothetical protein